MVSAPSGAGKTTLCKRLLQDLPGLAFSVSLTTRPARDGEREGVDYYFVDPAEFDRRRQRGDLIEWAVVDGQLYGTSAAAVQEATARGIDVLLDIDTLGAASIRTKNPEAILIFIMPPGTEALKERLARRGTEDPGALARRLSLARGEVEKWPLYDYVVVNEDLETAYDQLRSIVVAARCGRERQAERLRALAAGFGAERGAGS